MFTIIKDENGKEIIVPKSHRSMADVRRRIAEEKIKAFNLDCTPEEYWERCKEKQNNGKAPTA
jgi:hypothetical protein